MKFLQTLLTLLLFSLASVAQEGYKTGDIVRNFSLKNVDGKMLSLSDHNTQKGVIVIFTCNHCPFSIAYEDRIIALHKKYAALGYPVIAINPNDKNAEPSDSYEGMVKRAKEKNFSFPYLHDESQEIAKAFGAKRTPHVFLLSRTEQGFRVEYIGAIDDNFEEPEQVKEFYLENALKDLLAGKKPSLALTKAIGCTIKWKKS